MFWQGRAALGLALAGRGVVHRDLRRVAVDTIFGLFFLGIELAVVVLFRVFIFPLVVLVLVPRLGAGVALVAVAVVKAPGLPVLEERAQVFKHHRQFKYCTRIRLKPRLATA